MTGTRELVLSSFFEWIRYGERRIFWLAGMAGTGKTSIAVTLCRMLHANPNVILGGAFFCSRSAGSLHRTEVRRIIPTLAASFAELSAAFATALAAQVKKDPRIGHKPVSSQIDPLLVEPLGQLTSTTYPVVFLVDALDECSDQRELGELLIAIAGFESDAKVKFILTSRPEMHIRGTPISSPDHSAILQLHTISEKEVTSDIRHYITCTLNAAATEATWYTQDDIEALVRLSQGLFIFASTVLLYVLSREHVKGRKERLYKVSSAAAHGTAVTASLDRIYEMIVLEAARSDVLDEDELRASQRVVACILAARSSLSVQALADFLDSDVEEVRGSLERLHSVIHLPAQDAIPGVRVLHASFADYITSRAAHHILVDAAMGDGILARGCLHVMFKLLHFNISRSESSYGLTSPTRPNSITLSLEYACLEWIYHIAKMPDASVLDGDIHTVFCPRFLFWLEVLCVLQKIRRAAAMLVFAAATVCK